MMTYIFVKYTNVFCNSAFSQDTATHIQYFIVPMLFLGLKRPLFSS